MAKLIQGGGNILLNFLKTMDMVHFILDTAVFIFSGDSRVQRKSVLQPAIRASCSYHLLAHKSFQLAPKLFLISRIDYNPSVIWISQKNSTCPLGKLRTKITSPMAKSTSLTLSDMTFFARWDCRVVSCKTLLWVKCVLAACLSTGMSGYGRCFKA